MNAHLSDRRRSAARSEDGVALIVTLMVLLLVSALMVGFVSAVVADQRASGLDRDQTQAYAAAHAGLEQLTSDLSDLFDTDFSPEAAEITALTATPPSLPGFTFLDPGGASGYRIGFTPNAKATRRLKIPTAAPLPRAPTRAFAASSRPTTSR